MPSKIESSLKPEEFWDFCAAVAQLAGGRKGATLAEIQRLASEWEIGYISLNSAKAFRDGAFAEYLEDLQSAKEMAQHIAGAAKAGIGLSDAASSVLEQKLFKTALQLPDNVDPMSADFLTKSVERIRASNRNARRLEADLAIAKRRIALLEERERLAQLDAAALAIEHAEALRGIASDVKLDAAAKLERARLKLFGPTPEGTKTLKQIDDERSKGST